MRLALGYAAKSEITAAGMLQQVAIMPIAALNIDRAMRLK